MSNTLGNYNETFFAQEALIQLEKVLGMGGRVYRGYNADPQIKGTTISVRRPSTFTAQNAPSATNNDLSTESMSITLDKWKEVKFKLTDKDLALASDRIIGDHVRPAAVALADAMDQDVAALYKDIPWYSTQTGTPALADLNAIAKIMFDNKVPTQDRHYMVEGATQQAYLNAMAASGMTATMDAALREGTMGRISGFDVWANQNCPIHTSGVAVDATGTVDGVNAVGATTIVFSGVTAGITWKTGDSFSIAGNSQRYVFTADGTDADGAACSATFAPALKVATAGAEVITIFLGGASKYQTLAFHRNAFCLATAPLSELGNQLGAQVKTVADPITNIALRSRMWYEGSNSAVFVGLDVLYGVKTLDCNLAVRGNAA